MEPQNKVPNKISLNKLLNVWKGHKWEINKNACDAAKNKMGTEEYRRSKQAEWDELHKQKGWICKFVAAAQ